MWDTPGAWGAVRKNNGAYAVDALDQARLVTPTMGADQYSEITYSQDPGSSSWIGVATRVQGPRNGSGYLAIAYAGEVRLYRTDDSGSLNFALLASASAPIGTAPMRLRLESQGSNHRVYFNGVQLIDFTETLYIKGQPGIAASVFGGPTVQILSFAGGAIPEGTGNSTHRIIGTITGSGGPGATVTLSGAATAITTADALGVYNFSGLSNGSYVVTPNNIGYVFTPASQTINVSNADATANFTSALPTFSISGNVTGPGGVGATVSLSGTSTATTTTDGSGNYSFNGLVNGSYTVSASNGSYVITPASQTILINGSNGVANFASSPPTYGITGTISGSGGPNAIVTLNGASFASTTADASGNYSFTGLVNGPYFVTVGNPGYVFTPATQDVVINNSNYTGLNFATVSGCPSCDTIWPASATPLLVDSGDSTANELGIKFRADADGYITGLRFYKSVNNTGTHAGHLWTSTGTLLGTATFVGESSVGWQQVMFASPVPVVANTTYVASYFAPSGHYSGDANYFVSSGVDNAPLHALPNGLDGPNGVYLSTQTGGFPTATNQSSNYWVDVIYSNSRGYSIIGTISGPGAAGATVNLTGPSTATTTSDASGNFSFNGLANGTYTVTPTNGTYIFTPPSLVVTVNTGHVMNVNFTSASTAVLSSVTLNPTSVPAGATAIGTVTLNGPAPNGGTVVTLSSSNTVAAQVPASVTVAANTTSATFIVTTSSVSADAPLTISATSGTTQTANFTVLSAVLSTVTLNPISVVGGTSSTGQVTLTKPAPNGGAVVTLSSNNTAAAQVPVSVTVLAGTTTVTFQVTTTPVAANTVVNISGTYGTTRSGSLTVQAPKLTGNGLIVSPTSVIGGTSSTGTVKLTGPAPSGGSVVTLSSSNTAAAQVPPSVTVPAGATTATFTINTSPVGNNTSVTLTGIYGVTDTANLTVTAATLKSVSLSPTSVTGGTPSTGTVTLTGPAPAGGTVVTLLSNKTLVAQVPASVTVAANSTAATFAVTTSPVGSNTSVSITGTLGVSRSATLTVTAPILSSLVLNPTTVKGSSPSTGTVTLTGPAPSGGTVVTLSSSATTVATVPASVTVAAGNASATFTVTTKTVTTTRTVTISATRSVTKTASLTVTP